MNDDIMKSVGEIVDNVSGKLHSMTDQDQSQDSGTKAPILFIVAILFVVAIIFLLSSALKQDERNPSTFFQDVNSQNVGEEN